jgi:phosphatidylinositol phospholipase C beta
MSKNKISISIYICLQLISFRTDIEELFKSLTKTETLTTEKLIDFLNEKQRDDRLNEMLYPQYNKKRVMEIITKYEPDPEVIKAEAIR